MIQIFIDNVYAKIVGLSDPKVIKELSNKMSYYVPGHQYMSNRGSWDGKIKLLSKSGVFFSGLSYAAEEILKKHKLEYKIVDKRKRVKPNRDVRPILSSKYELRDYQLDALNSAWDNGGGILKLATGGGKSIVLSTLAMSYDAPIMIYVIGIELLYQMKNTIEEAFGIECGIIGDGLCDIKRINICTMQTAAAAYGEKFELLESDITDDKKKVNLNNKKKIKHAVENAKVFILDECQYAGARSITFLNKRSLNASHKFLLSATPYREQGDDILIDAIGGARIFDLPASELIEKGWLVQPKITFIEVPTISNPGRTYAQICNSYIVENEVRNDLIIKVAKQLVKEGRKVLILITRVQHGKILLEKLNDSGLRVVSLDGSDNTEDRLASIEEMKNGDLDIMIASKIFDQGIDISNLSALVLANSGKSSARALQRIGRVIRPAPGKKDSIVIDFYDNVKYLSNHSRARRQVYETEPKYQIKTLKYK